MRPLSKVSLRYLRVPRRSFNVLMQELRGLALDISLYDTQGERMEVSDLEDSLNRMRRRNKIKLDSIERTR